MAHAAHQIDIKVDHDHLEHEAKAHPINALAELIWNALDAEADQVDVCTKRNSLGGIERIDVQDDGHGILPDSERFFATLGGSWKRSAQFTPTKKRALHGKEGKGRLKSFALGSKVEWRTIYLDEREKEYRSYNITGSRLDLRHYDVTAPILAELSKTGTTVSITNIRDDLRALDSVDNVVVELAHRLAPYLRKYPLIRVRFDGKAVNPSTLEASSHDYRLPGLTLTDGKRYDAKLNITEWKIPMKRRLCLCDRDGMMLDERPIVDVREPGRDFTVYLSSDAVSVLAERNAFALNELDPDLQTLVDVVKPRVKAHFRARRAEEAADQVRKWKEQGVYPYSDQPKNDVEIVSRQVFDVVAKQVQDYLPGFGEDAKATLFSMRLMRQALEESPEHLRRVVLEVLELPQEKQKDLAAMLDKGISFIHIIDLAKRVSDRLDFIQGLKSLLFTEESKKRMRERSELHKLIDQNPWLFGEEYVLSVSDKGLDKVLRAHLDTHRQKRGGKLRTVRRENGRIGIVDLMLSRKVIHPGCNKVEHLVIELKAPKVPIGPRELEQTISYAQAVIKDDQFINSQTCWRFWALSNRLEGTAETMAHQRGKPPGLAWEPDGGQDVQVWAMSWSELLANATRRLHWVQENLAYTPDDDDARQHLSALYEKYLPVVAREQGND
ncbi:MAG: ATP-binding protein [Tepidisphaeraceae bacterium]